MKLLRNCKEVTALVLQGHDRSLGTIERLSLRLHWLACDGCQRFRKQSELMAGAMDRWRRYRDSGDGGDAGL